LETAGPTASQDASAMMRKPSAIQRTILIGFGAMSERNYKAGVGYDSPGNGKNGISEEQG
jgi:hypothetical protein